MSSVSASFSSKSTHLRDLVVVLDPQFALRLLFTSKLHLSSYLLWLTIPYRSVYAPQFIKMEQEVSVNYQKPHSFFMDIFVHRALTQLKNKVWIIRNCTWLVGGHPKHLKYRCITLVIGQNVVFAPNKTPKTYFYDT